MILPKRCYRYLYYILPISIILTIACMGNIFHIDKKVINTACLWDMAGRPYEVFLHELNLPHSVGAVLVSGTKDNLEKTEKYYKKHNIGDIFTSQLRSLFAGTWITEYSIASYINLLFCICAIIFSVLAGYFIFKNGYTSILIFFLIMLFRFLCQGLIYGLPLRHAYAVFNPLMAFSIIILIIIYFKDFKKRYWALFMVSGFITAYINHIRTSEGQIVILALFLVTIILFLKYLISRKKYLIKLMINVPIMLMSAYIGYMGYYKIVTAFEQHRDVRLNFTKTEEKMMLSQPACHSLYVSLFRYEIPNRFHDKTGYDAVFEKYPEIEKKYSNDVSYVELANSVEYNTAIRKVYLEFILNKPEVFLMYLVRSMYDYFLFLPYYSWTGIKSAHAYLPIINKTAVIDQNDLAPFFKDTPFKWLVNLRMRYLPNNMLFWLYFIAAYALFINAVYVSIFKNNKIKTEIAEINLPIYLLRGMLVYFFFASIVRMLIPVHGQGAVAAFNIIIIYNMVRILFSAGNIKMKPIRITEIKLPRFRISAWQLLLYALILIFLLARILLYFNKDVNKMEKNIIWNFNSKINGWISHLSILSLDANGVSDKCLRITTSENSTGYAYTVFSVEVDKVYKITAYFKRGNSLNGQIKVGTAADDTSLYYSGVLKDKEWEKYEGVFRASSPVVYITLVNLTSNRNETIFFDNVTVAEVKYY